jgi:hypothetical protein
MKFNLFYILSLLVIALSTKKHRLSKTSFLQKDFNQELKEEFARG